MRSFLLTWVAAAALGLAGLAHAQSANDTCLLCHGKAAAKDKSGKSIAVDRQQFGDSVHGQLKLKCTSCHTDTSPDKIPHPEKLKPVDCSGCHEKPVAEYKTTVHGKARAHGSSVAATCANCHGTHDIRRSEDKASRTHYTNLEATCGACHGNDALIEKAHLPGGNVRNQYHDSIHGKLLGAKGEDSGAPTCTTCHGAHEIHEKDDAESRVNRAKIPSTCGVCHSKVKAVFFKGQHGKMRQAGNPAAPVCSDCHSAHNIQRHDLPQWQLDVIKECGNCHNELIKTYRDTFHGQVTALGYTRVATCASCHGAHEMLPASDPASKVSAQNRLATCQQCHPKANANFAMYDPHANRHRRDRGQILYFTNQFMEILLIGVFAFFGLHTILWFFRSMVVVLRRGRGGSHTEEKR